MVYFRTYRVHVGLHECGHGVCRGIKDLKGYMRFPPKHALDFGKPL